MPPKPDYLAGANTGILLLSARTITATATGTGQSTAGLQGQCVAIANVTRATAGTSPTCIVTIETSSTVGGTYTVLKTFTTATDAAGGGILQFAFDADASLGFVRAVATVGGTSTPTFALGVTLHGLPHYG